MAASAFDARTREALAEVEAQRDDGIGYLSAIREVLGVLARGHAMRPSAQGIAERLVRVLSAESCAIALRTGDAPPALIGFASQGRRLGGPAGGIDEAGWLGLAGLVGRSVDPACFRRTSDGGFTAVPTADLAGEGFVVLPFAAADAGAGVLALHWLVAPPERYGRVPGLALIAEAVGQALTVAHLRDIREQVADTLREELGRTRRAISSRDDDIVQLAEALVQANAVKRDFLGLVSHELRTPLNAILGYGVLLRDGTLGDLVPTQTAALDRVLAATRNLNELIGDMLFFVQVDRDRFLLRPEALDVADEIAEAIASLREQPDPAKVQLRVEVAPEVRQLTLDRTLLRRIVFHLVGNAFKFTKAGAVSVRVEAGDAPGSVLLTIADTGSGFAPERVDELFELFTQADSSLTRQHGGLGMGLPLVDRCVRLLGGEITVTSMPGAGATFRVRLPAAVADEAGERMASAETPAP